MLHVPGILAGPGCKKHKAWPEQSQHAFSAFGLWLAESLSSVIAVDYNGRGASDDGCKALCLGKGICKYGPESFYLSRQRSASSQHLGLPTGCG